MAEEKKITAPENNAEDLDAIMKKYDRESNTRVYDGVRRQIVKYLLAAFSIFVVYMNLFATWGEQFRRPLFLGLIIVLTIVIYPAKKGAFKLNHIPWYDWIIAGAGALSYFYYVFNNRAVINRATRINSLEIALGIIGIIILIECCRRVVGLPIIFVSMAFVIYAFSTGISLKKIIYNLFYTTTGVIGTPIGVCSTYIVLFIIFGAFLEATGISDFFIQCANCIAGSATGGPAKVSVISSALCGMVSGSSVGNTVTTGSITIPLMKKTGYPAEFAGAVEAASSTGGQIMPPIMGAAAFLMAEIVGVPYSIVVMVAVLPALLYFLGVFLMVHFRAKRLGLKGIDKAELPKLKDVIKKVYLLIPLIMLIYLIIAGKTMSRSAIISTIACIVVSFINKEHRMTWKKFVDALETGAKNTLSIAIACGVAGIIAGVVTMTGLGQIFISAIVSVAHGNLLIALFLTMITCIILGMGVPTTANYIIMATTCAPILTTGMGLNALCASMFVFYFGIVADITPPVALAAYAGSAIAKSEPMKTAFNATKLAIGGFIVPYIFCLNPAMLLIDTTPIEIIIIFITSLIGMVSISAALEGFLVNRLNAVFRILLLAAGLMTMYPGVTTDVIGIAVIVVIGAFQFIGKKNKKLDLTEE